jgi:hypothetical protein
MVGLIPIMMGIGAFAIDIMHGNTVKGEILKACDAGALAGARELPNWAGGSGQTIIEARAETVTGMNRADAKFVADTTANCTVTATVVTPPVNPNGTGGVVRVDASMQTGNLWAQLFSQAQQTLGCSADATCVGVQGANPGSVFPLAVTIDGTGPVGRLQDKNMGDSFQLGWSPGTDNVFWTGLTTNSNASNVSGLIGDYGQGNMNISVEAKGQSNPGTMLDTTNGTQAGNIAQIPGFVGQTVFFPIITTSSTELIGYLALRIDSVTVNGANSIVIGTIVPAPMNGTGAHVPNTGSDAYNTWLSNNEPIRVRLIQ